MKPLPYNCMSSKNGLGHGPERAWVRVPKGPGSRGNWVTWPRYEFQKGLGHGPERAWVRVPKGPESRKIFSSIFAQSSIMQHHLNII